MLPVRDEVPEVRALDGDVTEYARSRRRRVPDLPVVADDQDGVRGVLYQRTEVRLVFPADHLVAEQGAVHREGLLVREDLHRREQDRERTLPIQRREHPDQRIARWPV